MTLTDIAAQDRFDINELDQQHCQHLNWLLDQITILASRDSSDDARQQAWEQLLTEGFNVLPQLHEAMVTLVRINYQAGDHLCAAAATLEKANQQRDAAIGALEELTYALETLDEDNPQVAQVVRDVLARDGLIEEDDAWQQIEADFFDALRYGDAAVTGGAVERFIERVRYDRLNIDEMTALANVVKAAGKK